MIYYLLFYFYLQNKASKKDHVVIITTLFDVATGGDGGVTDVVSVGTLSSAAFARIGLENRNTALDFQYFCLIPIFTFISKLLKQFCLAYYIRYLIMYLSVPFSRIWYYNEKIK